jgi:hypothetical protein
MADPQTLYLGAGADAKPLPSIRVNWDGAGTLTTGSIVCYDLSNGAQTVTKPLTADLGAPAGVYIGRQGGSITEAATIDIVPIDAYGTVVDVLAADDEYAVNDSIGIANDSFAAIILQNSGDETGHSAGIIIEGFIGLCLTAGTDPGTIKVLLTK